MAYFAAQPALEPSPAAREMIIGVAQPHPPPSMAVQLEHREVVDQPPLLLRLLHVHELLLPPVEACIWSLGRRGHARHLRGLGGGGGVERVCTAQEGRPGGRGGGSARARAHGSGSAEECQQARWIWPEWGVQRRGGGLGSGKSVPLPSREVRGLMHVRGRWLWQGDGLAWLVEEMSL